MPHKLTIETVAIVLALTVFFVAGFMMLSTSKIIVDTFTEFKDENGGLLDQNTVEKEEQDMALEYIKPGDVVLELGARYGMVADILINLVGKENVVMVDPDTSIIAALKTNLAHHGDALKIWNGTVLETPRKLTLSGYGTHTLEACDASDASKCIPNMSYEQLQTHFGVRFNSVVADCEGCIIDLITHLSKTGGISHIRKLLVEKDMDGSVDYSIMHEILKQEGFVLEKEGFREAWIRRT